MDYYGFRIQVGRFVIEIRTVTKNWRRRWYVERLK